MMRLLVFVVIAVAGSARADDHSHLSNVVRQLIVKHLPTPAVQSSKNWDHQKEMTVRMNAERQGPFKWTFEPVKEKRNDGHWTRVALNITDAAKNLKVELSDIATPEDGKTTFKATLSAPVSFKFEQQMWKLGVRLYSGETRGRCEAKTVLKCQAISKTDWAPGKLLPSQLFQVSIRESDLTVDTVKIEHTAGVGGEAAEKIGNATIAAIKLLKPNLESDLTEKANAAIVKAGQSKEVKLDFDKLLAGRK